MRIVHELFTELQVGGSLRPYTNKIGDTALPKSGYVDMVAIAPKSKIHDGDAIHIDADLAVLYRGLLSAIEAVEMMADGEVEAGRLDPYWISAAIRGDEREASE